MGGRFAILAQVSLDLRCMDGMGMDAREVAGLLLDAKAVKISFDPPFIYSSGMRAPIYTDNRVLVSFVKERGRILDGLAEFVANLEEELGAAEEELFLSGTATAGIPWAAFLAERFDLPMVYVRPKPKEHGAGRQIEGSLPAGREVVVVEDLVTTGGSSLATIAALRGEGGAHVEHLLAIFTYGFEKMHQALEEGGVKLHVLTDFETLLDVARERGMVDTDQYAKILEYKSDPEGWAAKMGL